MRRHFPALHQACSGVGSARCATWPPWAATSATPPPAPTRPWPLALRRHLILAGPAASGNCRFLTSSGPARDPSPAREILKRSGCPPPARAPSPTTGSTPPQRGGLPLLGVGTRLTLSTEGLVEAARISLGVCAPMPPAPRGEQCWGQAAHGGAGARSGRGGRRPRPGARHLARPRLVPARDGAGAGAPGHRALRAFLTSPRPTLKRCKTR